MKTSKAVEIALIYAGKTQVDLAKKFGISTQAMTNKKSKNSWYVRDITDQLHELVGCDLVLRLATGEEIVLTDEAKTKKEGRELKKAKSKKLSSEEKKAKRLSRLGLEEGEIIVPVKPAKESKAIAEEIEEVEEDFDFDPFDVSDLL